MVLYTPLSYHDIYKQEETPYQLISYNGRTLYAKQNEGGELQLMQLISTNPQDFLQNEFTPGTILPNEVVHESK